MKYPGDDRILELLDESDLILSPSIIAANIELTRHHVSARLSELKAHGLVESVETGRGHYRITEQGQAYLAGELDATDLDVPDE